MVGLLSGGCWVGGAPFHVRMTTVGIVASVLGIIGALLLVPLLVRGRFFFAGPGEVEHRLARALQALNAFFENGKRVLVGRVSDRVLEWFSIASVLVFIGGLITAFHLLWKYWGFLQDYWYALVPLLLLPALTEGLLFYYGEGRRRVPARLGCLVLVIVTLNLVTIGVGAVLTLILLYVLAAVLVLPLGVAYGLIWIEWRVAKLADPLKPERQLACMGASMLAVAGALGAWVGLGG